MRTIIIAILCAMIPAVGIGGNAIVFDGADDYVMLGNDASLKMDLPVTFSSWIYITGGQGTFRSIFNNDTLGNFGITKYYGIIFRLTPSTFIALMYGDGDDNSSASRHGKTGTTALQIGQWYHIVAVARGYQDIDLYVNGVDDSGSYAGTGNLPVYTGAEASIGRLDSNNDFSGSIGEVLIYNKSLSASEIQAMYASKGAWYPRTGLVARWTMSGNGKSTGQVHANGFIIKDSAGSNNGTIVDGSDSSMVLVSSPTRQKRGRR